jgi:hypothetical protein
MTKQLKIQNWLSSKQALESVKIKSCDLMHYRLKGKLEFMKLGNAYFYSKESLDQLKKNQPLNK